MGNVPVGYLSERLGVARDLLVVGDLDGYRDVLRDVVKLSGDYPILGLDIDGVVTDFVDVFRALNNSWPGLVCVVSFRSDYGAAEKLLRELGIYFDKLVLSPTLDKSDVVRSLGIGVFVDDQDECVRNIDDNVVVLKVRNGGNFVGGKWLYSRSTGRLV